VAAPQLRLTAAQIFQFFKSETVDVFVMTREETCEVIERALQTHCWSCHGKTLPEVIADAIADAQLKFQKKHHDLPVHHYSPGTSGECSVCGMGQFAPQHDGAQWKSRAEKAEALIAAIREALR
jgi:hypothetical protein